jgi:hypothetical protein
MAQRITFRRVLYAQAIVCALLVAPQTLADDAPETKQQLQELKQENLSLQEQLKKQAALIEALTHKVNNLEQTSTQRGREIDALKDNAPPAPATVGSTLGKVNLSGEGAVAFFNSGRNGLFPNSEFRVDEAKLFIEAPVMNDVYFYTELNLITREAFDLSLQLGEAYLDFENISILWNQERTLNLRIGRIDTPFGEEYIYRDAIDDALITHSLSDLWGVDEGIELYGSMGKFSYVAAVQNGGPSGVRDFDGDKAVIGRLSYDPAKWLHLSASAMRTGNLKYEEDAWSEQYFGNGWFMPIDPAHIVRYHANLVEGDVELRLPHGHVRAFGGFARYNDDDSTANNQRDIYYYSVEGVHDVTRKLYAAVRFSQILCDKGYMIGGLGDMGEYIFSGALTKEIWRVSLGLGYRWSPNLITKIEYAIERGEEIGGATRNHEDLFALQAALKF